MSPWLEDTGVGFQTSLCIYLVAEREVWIVHKFNRGEGRKASQDAPPSSSAPVQAPKKLPQGAVARQTGVWAQKFLRAANHRPRSRGRKSHGARSTRQPWSAARKGGWWDPVRLLYDVKSSWSAAGLLHQQHSHQRAASSPRASCLLRRLFRVGAFRPSKPPPALRLFLLLALLLTQPPATAGRFSEWQFCTPGF